MSLKKQKSFYGSKIKVLSPAKLNLYLKIKGKYSNGFHCLESLIERISLFDEISISLNKTSQIKLFSNNKSLETKNNLVFKAAELLKKKFK
ncbi:MAG: hypothetical protein P9M02_04085, partial [Candidatus Susulua stagnicola]|nr:hypothetical protein [Candidatus Susulua stagnicola]